MSQQLLFNEDKMNLLPHQGSVFYFGKLFTPKEADDYLETLLRDIAWQHDEAIIFGKKIITKRKVAWYANKNYAYTYSKITRYALPWTDTLLSLKKAVESLSQEKFNACLLNLYHDGNEGMAWHSDDEKDLKKHGAIASLSFGAERRFSFKHKKTHEKVDLQLEHGSLLIMKGCTQDHWLHQVPKAANITAPRINLTFRLMNDRALT